MRYRYSFWFSRRTRRINHIGQIPRAHVTYRVFLGKILPIGIQPNNPRPMLGQSPDQSFLCQEKPDFGVGRHESDTFFRIARIKWYISPTGFENRQQSDDHLQGTLHANTLQGFRFDAERL